MRKVMFTAITGRVQKSILLLGALMATSIDANGQ
ncbi:hypothetical protein LCGC14_2766420, partial [marine sediment metagenome]